MKRVISVAAILAILVGCAEGGRRTEPHIISREKAPTTYVAPSASNEDIFSNVPSGDSIYYGNQKTKKVTPSELKEITPVESEDEYKLTSEEQAEYEALHKSIFGDGGGGSQNEPSQWPDGFFVPAELRLLHS
jgi:hypothetical protein